MRTALSSLLGVPHPIVGFNRSPGVVAAVTNAGVLGVLAASAQVVGSLGAIRPAAEITRQIVAECEQRIAELGALV
jgi:hypothetical protein